MLGQCFAWIGVARCASIEPLQLTGDYDGRTQCESHGRNSHERGMSSPQEPRLPWATELTRGFIGR